MGDEEGRVDAMWMCLCLCACGCWYCTNGREYDEVVSELRVKMRDAM